MAGGNTIRMDEVRTSESTAELVRQATEQISTLIRDELALAKAEMSEKASRAGRGAGLFGGAGLVSLYGVLGVLAAVVLLLALVMPAWVAALLVGIVLLVIAGVLALVGRSQVRQATPPVPEEAVRGVRADVDAVTTAVQERGHRG
jgi:Putative Actinobacterial Holin-X, holin superfamily III